MKKLIITTFSLLFFFTSYAQEKKNPSFEEVLSLKSYNSPVISPDGQHVLFSQRITDWKENRYDNEIFLSKNGGEPFQITQTIKGSSFGFEWSPDGKWISFLANRGNKTQIFVMRVEGGEAFPITFEKQNIQNYAWSPDGKQIAFRMAEDKKKATDKRESRFGKFEVDDQEYSLSGLWLIDFDPNQRNPSEIPCYDEKEDKPDYDCIEHPKAVALIDSVDFTVTNFQWSPNGKYIAFGFRPDPLINTSVKSDIGLFDMATKSFKTLIANPSTDGLAAWSPDSKEILYTTSLDNTTSYYYKNGFLYRASIDGKNQRQLNVDLDERIYGFNWTSNGLYARANLRTKRVIVKMDPNTGKTSTITSDLDQISNFTITKDGKYMALSASKDNTVPEIYHTSTGNFSPKKLTDANQQIEGWKTAQSEVIQWKSKDGAMIEGVVHKPQDFDPNKKYPLLVMVHGGPTGTDRPTPVPGYVYPCLQWLNKGAIVLRPNYRGSAGYGEDFRSLNVENLGVGDAWDVLSGVDHLIEQGYIDADKMGCMGWSQGGYISAFLTTSSNRFKAISVGAGISDWITYYVNTDIHPFTRQYLKADPWENEEIYRKTSPMTYINNASTPTLIQHGEFDRRVPIPNAYKLLQGLRDKEVDAKLVVYKGFGHGITKPKERLAAVWHNWQWFGKYVWGEEVEMP